MGQARRKKLVGIADKKLRFIYLLKKITNRYNEKEITDFMKRRFK